MRLTSNTLFLLLCALIGCVYPADQSASSFAVAMSYRDAWANRYGWPAPCEWRWQSISISFVDVVDASDACKKNIWDASGRIACHHASWADGDTLLTIPYNYQPEQQLVHELTHALLLCSGGDADSDHTSEVWSWQSAWVDIYLQNYSVIDAIKEAQ